MQITQKNKNEAIGVKQGKKYQELSMVDYNPSYSTSQRIADINKCISMWESAKSNASQLVGLHVKLCAQAFNYAGDLSDIYPIVNCHTWSGVAGQNELMGGAPPGDRVVAYTNIININKKRIANLKNSEKIQKQIEANGGVVIKSPSSNIGIADLNGNINVSNPNDETPVTNTPAINPNGSGIPVAGAQPTNPGAPVDPTTGAPIEDDVPTGLSFKTLVLAGIAVAGGLFVWTARK